MGLWNLYEVSLLLLNAITILHEERFLAKVGWGRDAVAQQQQQQFQYGVYGAPDARQQGFKSNTLNLIHSIRTVMRIPLIFFNVVTIIIKLIAG